MYGGGGVGGSCLGPSKQHVDKPRNSKAGEPATPGVVSGVDCSRCKEHMETAVHSDPACITVVAQSRAPQDRQTLELTARSYSDYGAERGSKTETGGLPFFSFVLFFVFKYLLFVCTCEGVHVCHNKHV